MYIIENMLFMRQVNMQNHQYISFEQFHLCKPPGCWDTGGASGTSSSPIPQETQQDSFPEVNRVCLLLPSASKERGTSDESHKEKDRDWNDRCLSDKCEGYESHSNINVIPGVGKHLRLTVFQIKLRCLPLPTPSWSYITLWLLLNSNSSRVPVPVKTDGSGTGIYTWARREHDEPISSNTCPHTQTHKQEAEMRKVVIYQTVG